MLRTQARKAWRNGIRGWRCAGTPRFRDDERIEMHTRASINAGARIGEARDRVLRNSRGRVENHLLSWWRRGVITLRPLSLSLSLSFSLSFSFSLFEGRRRGFNYADESAHADARPSSIVVRSTRLLNGATRDTHVLEMFFHRVEKSRLKMAFIGGCLSTGLNHLFFSFFVEVGYY